MPRVCTICKHKKRKEIDAAIASRGSNRAISLRYKVGSMSIQRHRQHIRKAVVKAHEKTEIKNGLSVWQKLEQLVTEAEKQYKANKGMLKATWFREIRGTIELGIKLGVEAHKQQQVYSDVTPAVLQMIEEAKQ